MGFFGKLKQNFSHGGVKVSLQTPASVSLGDGMVPLTVTVQATDAPAAINSVRVELNREETQQPMAAPGNTANNVNTAVQTVSQVTSNDAFNLAAGETRTLNLSLAMNLGKAAESILGTGALGQIAHGIGMLESAASAVSGRNYSYSFVAYADVAGISLDPSASQPVQVLKPGEIGGAKNFNINL